MTARRAAADILTYRQAARLLAVTVQTIRAYVRRGDLPSTYTGRRLPNGHCERGIPRAAVLERARVLNTHAREDAPDAAPVSHPPTTRPAPGRPHPQDGHPGGGPDSIAPALTPPGARLPIGASATSTLQRSSRSASAVGHQLALFDPEAPPPARPDHLPPHIPITRDGLPDLVALRQMGLDGVAGEYERRFRAVTQLRQLLADAAPGEREVARALVAEQYHVHANTIRNWSRAYDQWGWPGLVPGWGHHRGTYHSLPQALQRQVLDAYTYLTQLSPAQIYERIVRPWCEENDCPLPHPTTVRRFLRRSVPPIVRTVTREGARAYQEQHAVRVVRDLASAGVNGWWVSDHRLADTLVLVPDGKGTGWPGKVAALPCTCNSGRPRRECCSVRRPWWTATCDVASAAWIAWRISLQPTAATACHMLRDGILRWGLPEHWLRDNGKEFTANRLGGNVLAPRPADLHGRTHWPMPLPADVDRSTMWDQLGVQVHTAIPYSSWSKYIESLFSAFSRRCENWLPGWTGNSTRRRPEKLQAELEAGRLLALDQYVAVLADMISEWNTEHPVGTRTQPPAAFYADHLPRVPDPQSLTYLLQDVRRQVVRHGRLVLDGHVYYNDALALLSGVAVQVRWDPAAPDHVYVYPGDGRCLAVAEVERAAYGEWGEPNRLARHASRAQRQAVRSWAAQIKGACPLERLDPYGAHRAVAARIAAAEQVEHQTLEQTRALAEAQGAEASAPAPTQTVYQTDPTVLELRELRRRLPQ